jgi:hypothetical protein
MAKKRRTRYSSQVREEVRKRYPLCRNTEDREALAIDLGIGSVSKLYNLASRLGVAGKNMAPGEHEESHSHDRLTHRETPADTVFSKQDDRYILKEFGRRTIEDIAFYLQHSETAVLYRARHLKMRKPVKNWRVDKVARWLGMEEDEFHKLSEEGLEIFPLTGFDGQVSLEFVSTTSLARWMRIKKNESRLKKQGADQFFILEIQEIVEQLVEQSTEFESCKFLSHGHVCMNPRSELCFGLFCTNNDKYQAGEDPLCTVRLLELDDLRPEE